MGILMSIDRSLEYPYLTRFIGTIPGHPGLIIKPSHHCGALTKRIQDDDGLMVLHNTRTIEWVCVQVLQLLLNDNNPPKDTPYRVYQSRPEDDLLYHIDAIFKKKWERILGGIDFTFSKKLIAQKLTLLANSSWQLKEGTRLRDIPTFVIWLDSVLIKDLTALLDRTIQNEQSQNRVVYVRQVIFAIRAFLIGLQRTSIGNHRYYSVHIPEKVKAYIEGLGIVPLLTDTKR
jgi:hypothetical protein